MWDGTGLQYGREKIVQDTVHTINAFPDIRLFADEIVWAGDDEVGFHTSHRTVISGHNTGFSRFGPPTGRKVFLMCIANCIALENEIFEEWVLYDTAAMLKQLGLDMVEQARLAGNQIEAGRITDPRFSEPERLPGQGKPPHCPRKSVEGFDVADFLQQHLPLSLELAGAGPSSGCIRTQSSLYRFNRPGILWAQRLCLVGAFDHGRCSPISHSKSMICTGWGMSRMALSQRCAGALSARIGGMAFMARPSGRPVYLWGISQHTIQDGRIVEETDAV